MPMPFLRRKAEQSLGRDIALLIVLKLLLLYGIWALWFAHPMPKEERAENTARMLLNKK